MNTNKLLTLTALMLLSVGCSNKGNGDKFYVEYEGNDKYPIVHSTLDCKAIKGGVQKRLPGEADGMMCAKCMDDDLFEIAQTGKKADDDDDDD